MKFSNGSPQRVTSIHNTACSELLLATEHHPIAVEILEPRIEHISGTSQLAGKFVDNDLTVACITHPVTGPSS